MDQCPIWRSLSRIWSLCEAFTVFFQESDEVVVQAVGNQGVPMQRTWEIWKIDRYATKTGERRPCKIFPIYIAEYLVISNMPTYIRYKPIPTNIVIAVFSQYYWLERNWELLEFNCIV